MGSLQGAQVSGACAQAGPEHGRGGWSAGVSGGHGTARGTAGCVVCLSGVFPQLAGVCLESLCCALSEPAALECLRPANYKPSGGVSGKRGSAPFSRWPGSQGRGQQELGPQKYQLYACNLCPAEALLLVQHYQGAPSLGPLVSPRASFKNLWGPRLALRTFCIWPGSEVFSSCLPSHKL